MLLKHNQGSTGHKAQDILGGVPVPHKLQTHNLEMLIFTCCWTTGGNQCKGKNSIHTEWGWKLPYRMDNQPLVFGMQAGNSHNIRGNMQFETHRMKAEFEPWTLEV